MSFTVKEELITPGRAQALLVKRTRQRPINRAAVDDIKRQIKDGLWKLTHQGIGISTAGKLLDGQHRLTAIFELGVTVPMMVTYGLDETTFSVMDVGRKRRPSDVLGIEGYTRVNLLAAAAKIALQVFRGKVQYTLPIANPELLAFVAANEDLLEHYVAKAARLRYAKPTVAAIAFVFANVVGEERADQFVEDVLSGANLEANNPAFRLREKLRNRPAGTQLAVDAVLGWAFLAANKYFLGAPLRSMTLAQEISKRYVVDPKLGTLPKLDGV